MATSSTEQQPRATNHARQTLDEADAAAFIGISVSSLRKARTAGPASARMPSPPYIRVGRRVLYRVTDLNAWLDAHCVIDSREAA